MSWWLRAFVALCNSLAAVFCSFELRGQRHESDACNRKRHVGRFSAGVVMSRFDTGAVAMSGVDLRVHVASHQAQGCIRVQQCGASRARALVPA